MEPITPKTSENKTSQKGVKFWAVEDNAGTKYTIWDEALAQIWEANFGNEMEMDVKRSGNFLNIRGIEDKGQVLKEVQNGERSLNGQEQKPMVNEGAANVARILTTGYNKDKSIIAQCLVKVVIGQPRTDCEQTLHWSIKDAVNMYKEALELLG